MEVRNLLKNNTTSLNNKKSTALLKTVKNKN
jgi:hypothetical protein